MLLAEYDYDTDIAVQRSEAREEGIKYGISFGEHKKAVETAKQGKETALNNANKYRNEKLPEAEASADAIIKSAEASKTERINEATAQVARFNAIYEEFIKHPEVTKERMFFEAMEEVLPGLKVIIESPSGNTQTFYPLESFATIGTDSTN